MEEDRDPDLKAPRPGPTHLTSPLRTYHYDLLTGKRPPETKLDQVSLSEYRRLVSKGGMYVAPIRFSNSMADLIPIFSDFRPYVDSRQLQTLDEELMSAIDLFNIQHKSLEGGDQEITLDNPYLLRMKRDTQYDTYLRWRIILEQAMLLTGCVDVLDTQSAIAPHRWQLDGNTWVLSPCDVRMLTLHASKDTFCVTTDTVHFIGNRDYLLAVHDLVTQRVIALRSCYLALAAEITNYPTPGEINQLCSFGDRILEKMGNTGYVSLGVFESLCIGALLSIQDEKFVNNRAFLHEMVTAMKDGLDPTLHTLVDDWIIWLTQVAQKNPHHLFQLYGLFRIWGHPTVDVREGAKKLHQLASKRRVPNYASVSQIHAKFREVFFIQYYKKHRKYPPHSLDDSQGYLRSRLNTSAPFQITNPKYHWRDWKKVHLHQVFTVTPKMELSKLISDTAMSPTLPELYNHVSSGGKGIGPGYQRKVVVQYLKSALGDPHTFLVDIARRGFGAEENLAAYYPKERELKLNARMYCLLPPRKRTYVVLTEALLADHLLEYFPQITMMDSALDLLRRQYDLTADASTGVKKVFISLDFQKWNTNMRREETLAVFEDFDRLFGLRNVFTRTHDLWDGAYMYLGDGSYTPKMPTPLTMELDDFVWTNHKGGMEGLRQKGWTIWTVCLLLVAAEKLDFRLALSGQGDNQLLRLTFSQGRTIATIEREIVAFLDTLEALLTQVGPPLKRSETWLSSSLFLYGKFPILNGCPMSLSLKKIVRAFRMSNDEFVSLESSLSAQSACASAGCAADLSPTIPYLNYLIEASGDIRLHTRCGYLGKSLINQLNGSFRIPTGQEDHSSEVVTWNVNQYQTTQIRRCTRDFRWRVLLFPSALGGYPTLLLGDLISKGFPDPVSQAISLLFRIYHTGDQFVKNLMSPLLTIEPSNYVIPDLLCEDPLSLNLCRPSSVSEILRRQVHKYLEESSWIVNPYFKTFMRLVSIRQKPLCQALFSMKPLNPKIAGLFVRATLVGYAQSFVRKVDKTRTIIALARRTDEIGVMKRLIKGNVNFFNGVIGSIYRVKSVQLDPNKCATQQAQALRERTWGVPITGVTQASYWCYSQIVPTDGGSCPPTHAHPEDGYVLAKVTPNPSLVDPTFVTLGPQRPYFGSHTREKTTGYGKTISHEVSPLLSRPLELTKLIGWACDRDGSLAAGIETLLHSVTDAPIESLTPDVTEIAGSVEHRLQSPLAKTTCSLSLLYTPHSYVSVSTSPLSRYNKGGANVNLIFQDLILKFVTQVMARSLGRNQDTNPDTFHLHIRCPSCITEIYEGYVETDTVDWELLIPKQMEHPFCYIPQTELGLINPSLRCLKLADAETIRRDAQNVFALQVADVVIRELIEGENSLDPASGGGLIAGARSSSRVDYIWGLKLNPSHFFKHLFLRVAGYILSKVHPSSDEFLPAIAAYFESLPLESYKWAEIIYQHPSFVDLMVVSSWSGETPQSLPLNPGSCALAMRKSLLNYTATILVEANQEFLKCPITHYALSESWWQWNPYYLKAVENLLMNRRRTDASIWRLRASYVMEIMREVKSSDDGLLDLRSAEMSFWIRETRVSYLQKRELLSLNAWVSQSFYQVKASPDWVRQYLESLERPLSQIEEPEDVPKSTSLLSPLGIIRGQGGTITHQIDRHPKSLTVHLTSPGPLAPNRPFKTSTSSFYKLVSILSAFSNIRGQDGMCVGDGSGGFARCLLETYGFSRVWWNSLLEFHNTVPTSISECYPGAFMGLPELRDKLLGVKEAIEGKNDLTDPLYPEWIKTVIPEGFHPSLLTCDAEGQGAYDPLKSIQIMRTLITIGLELNIRFVVAKMYLSNPSQAAILVSQAVCGYQEVILVRSHFSTRGSTEIYLVARNPRLDGHPGALSISDKTIQWEGEGVSENGVNYLQQLAFREEMQLEADVAVGLDLSLRILPLRKIQAHIYSLLLMFGFSGQATPETRYFPHDLIRTVRKGIILERLRSSTTTSSTRRSRWIPTSFWRSIMLYWAIGEMWIGELRGSRLSLDRWLADRWMMIYPCRLTPLWGARVVVSSSPPAYDKTLCFKFSTMLTSSHRKLITHAPSGLLITRKTLVDLRNSEFPDGLHIINRKLSHPNGCDLGELPQK